jgi:3-oxoacyl-[acyl-carrier protein] reductase
MNLSLQNKHALVCGSTQGIGLAIAKELSLLGAHCTLLARNETTLKAVVEQLDRSQGQQHSWLAAVNNTGGPPPGPIVEATAQDFLNAFNQHIIASQELVQLLLPGMKREQYGRIINIISTSVRIPIANLGVSNTIRAAMASWAKTMSNELGAFGITVNNVMPGLTRTKRLQSLIEHISNTKQEEVAKVEADMQKEIPARRFGEASEIAAMAAFLATPAAAYVNGATIPVDGGKTGSI